jgi:hypothetical protein
MLINRGVLFFNLASKRGNLFFLEKDDTNVKISMIDLSLKLIFSKIFWYNDGFFLHCAGLVKDGGSHLFLGPGGAGKTTIARRSESSYVLSDDMVGVIRKGERFFTMATPWGQYNISGRKSNFKTPVASVNFLVKGNKLNFQRISIARAIAMVLSQRDIFYIEHASDLEFKSIFDLLNNFLKLHQTWKMYFTKEDNVWPYLSRGGVNFDERK